MKLINKFGFLLTIAAMLTACNDEVDYDGPGKWDATEGYQNVSFVKTDVSEELDPTDDMAATFQVVRNNTGASVTVPFTILENTDSVFYVTEPTFAEGDSLADFSFTFAEAEIGKTYTLKIQITDPAFTSVYSEGNVFTYEVTRVKWNLIGTGIFEENFVWEGKSEVQLYVNEGDSSKIRVAQPFYHLVCYDSDSQEYYYADPYMNGRQSQNIQLTLLQKGDEVYDVEVDKDDLVYFDPINSGYYHGTYGKDIMAYHPYRLLASPSPEDGDHSKVLAYREDGMPGQIQLAPYYYMSGVGGWDQTSADGMIIITFPGYKKAYEADIASDDFEWEEVFTGDFESAKLGSVTSATLYKGTCVSTTDGCDTVFAEKYGTAYAIPNLYAEDYNIYFCVKDDGTIAIPEEYAVQSTGMLAMGDTVFARLNTDVSSFSETVVTLNLTFQNADGSIVYGTTDEVLSNITWTEVGTIDYVYTQFFGDEYDDDGNCTVPYYDNGLTLLQRDDQPNTFKVEHWGYDVDFTFYWDQETNEIAIPEQFTGYTHPSYGDVMISDFPNYDSSYAQYTGHVDPETGEATVYVVYFVSAGVFGNGPENFTIHLNETADVTAQDVKAKNVKANFKPTNTKLHKQNRFVGKRTTNRKSNRKFRRGVPTPMFGVNL